MRHRQLPRCRNLLRDSDVRRDSTLEADVAKRLGTTGLISEAHKVEVLRLADLCDIHAKGRTIDFMKIDVEGGEWGVLESGDWKRYRPRLLIVEATVANTREENWQDWEPILIDVDYHKVWFDGLNNFYLRVEDLELRPAFRLPPNIYDGFDIADFHRLKRLLSDYDAPLSQIKALISHRSVRWFNRLVHWPELKELAEWSKIRL
jgi:hypothetical protein